MILPLASLLAACTIAWVGAPSWLPWWAVLAPTCVGAAGLLLRGRPLFFLGTVLGLALVAAAAWEGAVVPGLLATGLLLWSWDLGWVRVSLQGRGGRWGEMAAALARSSAWAVLASMAVAFLFIWLQLRLSFWWLLGLAAVTLVLLLRLLRALRASSVPEEQLP